MDLRIHILGASGSGTTTLGKALANQLIIQHLDTDDFYWEQSDIQFSIKRPVADRLKLIYEQIDLLNSWLISGSFCSWGDPLLPLITHVIFLQTPAKTREERLILREQTRYGSDILESECPQGKISRDFLQWANRYDSASLEQRSLETHMQWLDNLPAQCSVIRLDGSTQLDELVNSCISRLH